ncbi:transposase [Paraburkholderia sp. MMS20-SJTR3]|uniref:Transposase n=1 Tax=Paraburkholderia sejongensis TaxID=2886946 RepID=A0ABS8JZS7_9BURK|nr:transposase [Paraburkholderia sp. MMS20-SJTR3]MCC8395412.1 transposase [Paraburkholderia sp. MMS20-SJTR3]
MTNYRDVNDEEWQRVAELLPELRPRREMRGRPLANTREVLNGVLWVIRSGGVWSAMPRKYPSYQTCHRRFLAWSESGALKRLLHELYGADAEELCKTMQVRMRKHTMSARKSRHLVSSLRMLDSQPAVSSGPGYPSSLKHAA